MEKIKKMPGKRPAGWEHLELNGSDSTGTCGPRKERGALAAAGRTTGGVGRNRECAAKIAQEFLGAQAPRGSTEGCGRALAAAQV